MDENSEEMQQHFQNIVKQELANMMNATENVLDISSEEPLFGPSSSSMTARFPSAPFMPSDEDDSDDEDSLKIVYESLNSVPELNVEVNQVSREIILDFLKKDLSPYHGCYSSRCQFQQRDLGLCVIFNIGGRPINNRGKNEEPLVKSTPPPPPRVTALHCGICRESHVQIFKSKKSLMSSVCGHIFCNVCVDRSEESHNKCLTCGKKNLLGSNTIFFINVELLHFLQPFDICYGPCYSSLHNKLFS